MVMVWRISARRWDTFMVLGRRISFRSIARVQLTLGPWTFREAECSLLIARQALISASQVLRLQMVRTTTSVRRPVCHCRCLQGIRCNSRHSSRPRVLGDWALPSIFRLRVFRMRRTASLSRSGLRALARVQMLCWMLVPRLWFSPVSSPVHKLKPKAFLSAMMDLATCKSLQFCTPILRHPAHSPPGLAQAVSLSVSSH